MRKKMMFILFFIFTVILFICCFKSDKKLKIEIIRIEQGEFIMGENEDNGKTQKFKIEKPYYIGKYEITFNEYDQFCKETKRKLPDDRGWGRGKMPVINTNFNDDAEFCNWLSRNEGLKECYKKIKENNRIIWSCDFNANGYRLPAEAEWEFAAKGGNKSKGYKYSGSNNINDVAWFNDNSGVKPHETGALSPNELGIFDLSGNVHERCWIKSTTGNINNGDKIVCGGSFNGGQLSCTVTYRLHVNSGFSANNIGFRIARNAE